MDIQRTNHSILWNFHDNIQMGDNVRRKSFLLMSANKGEKTINLIFFTYLWPNDAPQHQNRILRETNFVYQTATGCLLCANDLVPFGLHLPQVVHNLEGFQLRNVQPLFRCHAVMIEKKKRLVWNWNYFKLTSSPQRLELFVLQIFERINDELFHPEDFAAAS